jgi:hypothetical protein
VKAVVKAKINSTNSESGNQNIKSKPMIIPGRNSENHSRELMKREMKLFFSTKYGDKIFIEKKARVKEIYITLIVDK